MSGIIGTEWLNSNLLRNYPLSQSATLTSNDSSFAIPNDLLVDMKISVPFIDRFHPSYVHVSAITIYPEGFVIQLGYSNPGYDNYEIIAVSDPILFLGFQKYSTTYFRGIVTSKGIDFSQAFGVAVIGNVEPIKSYLGTFKFSLEAGRLESCTVSLGLRRISGIKVQNSGVATPVLSGQLVFVSGSNHSIAVTSNTLKFNAINGGGLQVECACNDVELGPCIKTINNIQGDSHGNIVMAGGDCITVSNDSSGISISDSCAKPCCGCNELQVIVTDVESLSSQLSTLANQIAVLTSNIQSLQATCLASNVDLSSCAQDGN
jgi:hypothetical protein